MKASRVHLEALRSLLKGFERESGDVVIGKMIPEFAALLVQLSEELDSAQRKVVRLTWALFGLTAVLLVIGAVQLFVTVYPPQPQIPASTSQSANTNAQSVRQKREDKGSRTRGQVLPFDPTSMRAISRT